MADFTHFPMFPLTKPETPWRKLTEDFVAPADLGGEPGLRVEGAALTDLSRQAFFDISHYLRPDHLGQLAKIMDDGEASDNDRFVAYELLKNASSRHKALVHFQIRLFDERIVDAASHIARPTVEDLQDERVLLEETHGCFFVLADVLERNFRHWQLL